MPNESYPVWQLTDGTVVIQGEELPADKLVGGYFTWRSTAGKGQAKAFIREKVLTILERI